MWRSVVSVILLLAVLAAAASPPQRFSILGASVDVQIARGGVRLPATEVPRLQAGDTILLSFPKGVQFSRNPRWHLIVATLHHDYLQHQPSFAIADADLSRAPAGHVWSVPYGGDGTPVIFLVPEDGSRHGRGIPDAREAIEDLQNRSLLLATAVLSAGAAAKASTMDEFLRSLASIEPSELPDGRARVESATQELFGYDLADTPCFNSSVVQSTQYACAAQAVVQSYDSAPRMNAVAAVGAQLSVNTATYGMLIGALYTLLAKRRVAAHYIFVPGVIKPGSSKTNVYVDQPLSYDATAAKPSTIVYFSIGSKKLNEKQPAYGPAPSLPVCVDGNTLRFSMPFSGVPVYFRAHDVDVHAGKTSFGISASYDPLAGYSAVLNAQERAALASGATAKLSSEWGFERIVSPDFAVTVPRPAAWSIAADSTLVSGSSAETLVLSDGNAGMGSCVKSVQVTDALGRALPVTDLKRARDAVTATIDASQALGPSAQAIVNENGEAPSAPVTVPLLPAMPQITSAIAYLPHGTLVLRGSGLKYIDTVTLERTGITFGNGQPNADGSWTFTAASTPAAYQPAWQHETMAISFTMTPPDARTAAAPADVEYRP